MRQSAQTRWSVCYTVQRIRPLYTKVECAHHGIRGCSQDGTRGSARLRPGCHARGFVRSAQGNVAHTMQEGESYKL